MFSTMRKGFIDKRVVRVSVQSSEWSGGPFSLLGEIGGHLLLYGRLEKKSTDAKLRTIAIPIGSVTSIEPYFKDIDNPIADIIGPEPSLDLERLANMLDYRMTIFYTLVKDRMDDELWRLNDVNYVPHGSPANIDDCSKDQSKPVPWIGFDTNSFYSNRFVNAVFSNTKENEHNDLNIDKIRKLFPKRMFVHTTYEGNDETTTLQDFYDENIKGKRYHEIQITGYADSRGSYISNQQLSKFRAAMVFQGLIGAGNGEFPTHKARIKGVGESWSASGPTSKEMYTKTGVEKNPDFENYNYNELDRQSREKIEKGKPEYYKDSDWLRRVEICIVKEDNSKPL